MLDAYVRYLSEKDWNITMGQMRVPFTIDTHRSPHQQYFANRHSSLNGLVMRDVGATASYTLEDYLWFLKEVSNGCGLTKQRFGCLAVHWNFNLCRIKKWNLTLSTQKIHWPIKYYLHVRYWYILWNIKLSFKFEYLYKTMQIVLRMSMLSTHSRTTTWCWKRTIQENIIPRTLRLNGDHSDGIANDGVIYILPTTQEKD